MKNRKRQLPLSFRVTQTEKEAIYKKMKEHELKDFSSYAREMLTQGEVRIISHFEQAAIKKMLAELGKIGSNINQVARFMNTTDELYKTELDELLMNQSLITAHLKEILKIHQENKAR